MFKNLKLTAKVSLAVGLSLLITSLIGFLVNQKRVNDQATAAYIDVLRKTDGMASYTRAYFSANVKQYVPDGHFKDLKQVPVVVAWQVTDEYAKSQGLQFSTPSLHPRNPAHAPDDFERRALELFEKDTKLTEYWERATHKNGEMYRYAQPVRLTEDCLVCHGDPVGSKDDFGYTKEGMHVGDLKGAFVVSAPAGTLDSKASANTWVILMGALGGLVVTLGVVLLFMRKFVIKPVSAAAKLAAEIAANNLSVPDLEVTSHDEIGDALAALNTMKNNLHGVVQEISATAQRVAEAGEQMQTNTTEQAQGATTQTDRTLQVATAMQEMASTVAQISDNTRQAAESASSATEAAQSGGQVVSATVAEMKRISESVSMAAGKIRELGASSEQIGEIVGVIEDIADQTNLLALNAAIEAARAGEQGRGFAVVADEVRKLAERTSHATKEIADKIRSIQTETQQVVLAMEAGSKQVEEGVQTTGRAGDSLRSIIRMNDEMRDKITQIAAAATEQSAATEEVSNSISDIARLAETSSRGAQNSANACDELSSLAQDLENLVGQFKLSADAHSHAKHAKQGANPKASGGAASPEPSRRSAAAGGRS